MRTIKFMLLILGVFLLAHGTSAQTNETSNETSTEVTDLGCGVTDIWCKVEQGVGSVMIGVIEPFVSFIERYIHANPNINDFPIFVSVMHDIISILPPLFVVVMLIFGIKYILMSGSPIGRSEARASILKLFVGMIAVSISPWLYDMILSFSSGISGIILASQPSFSPTDMLEAIQTAPVFCIFSVIVGSSLMVAALVLTIRYILLLVFALIFPLILASYFVDLDIIRGIGRFGMNFFAALLFSQILMALCFTVGVVLIDSMNQENVVENIMVQMVAAAAFLGVAISPLIALGLLRIIVSAGASVLGGALMAAGAATGQPWLMAGGGLVGAAPQGLKGATGHVVGAIEKGKVQKGAIAQAETIPVGAASKQIWGNMDEVNPDTGNSVQADIEYASLNAIKSGECKSNDPGVGKIIATSIVTNAASSVRLHNSRDPKMEGKSWADGYGDLPKHVNGVMMPHWMKDELITTDDTGKYVLTDKGDQFMAGYKEKQRKRAEISARSDRPSTSGNFQPAKDSLLPREPGKLPTIKYTPADEEQLKDRETDVAVLEKKYPELRGGVRPRIIPSPKEISEPSAHKTWDAYEPERMPKPQRKALERAKKDFREGTWNPGMDTLEAMEKEGIDRESLSPDDRDYYDMRLMQEHYYGSLLAERQFLDREGIPTGARIRSSPSEGMASPKKFTLKGSATTADRVLADEINRLEGSNTLVLDNPDVMDVGYQNAAGKRVKCKVYTETGDEEHLIAVESPDSVTFHRVQKDADVKGAIGKGAKKNVPPDDILLDLTKKTK